jgi:hypothetical protein
LHNTFALIICKAKVGVFGVCNSNESNKRVEENFLRVRQTVEGKPEGPDWDDSKMQRMIYQS